MSRDLKPCPFCAKPLRVRRGVNAYGRCETPDCWANERKVIIPLDDPRQVDAWNTRAELSSLRGEGEHTVLEVFRAIMVANGDTDPGGASKGMFENLHPNERGYVEAVTVALASIPSTEGSAS